MLTIDHPGTPARYRMLSQAVTLQGPKPLYVTPGEDLFAVIHDVIGELDVTGCCFTLERGDIAALALMTGGPGRDGLPIGYNGPHAIATPATIISGAGNTGIDEDGAPFTHCHAVFCDAHGRLVGGHLLSAETRAGPQGMVVLLHQIHGGGFVRRPDAETGFTLFHPAVA